MSVERWWNGGGKPKYEEKTSLSATLSATNLTWAGVESNQDFRG